MDRFPSDAHISSWAGISPGNNESAGKRKSGKTNKGNKSFRATLVNSARSAAKTKNTYLSARYRRITSRRGGNRAAVAVGRTLLVIAYHIIKKHEPYKELGADYFDQRKKLHPCRHEITCVYWKPIYNLLEIEDKSKLT